jgi:hypothetical protein
MMMLKLKKDLGFTATVTQRQSNDYLCYEQQVVWEGSFLNIKRKQNV